MNSFVLLLILCFRFYLSGYVLICKANGRAEVLYGKVFRLFLEIGSENESMVVLVCVVFCECLGDI